MKAKFPEPKRLFHLTSYLQYPFLLLGLAYCYVPIIKDFSILGNLGVYFVEFNKALVFFGLGISLSTLQDTTKVQNKFSQWIYDRPRRTNIFLAILTSQALFYIIIGLMGLFGSNKYLQELSFGLISLGVGIIGILKAAGEMADYQRKKQLASKIISGPN
jgi:hypothetical protein